MESKRVLIVSASFYPQNSPRSFRTTELAKELARQGHDVTVYIPVKGNNYSLFMIEHGLKIKNLGKLERDAVDLKGGKTERLVRRVIIRILQLLIEWPDIELLFKVPKILKNEQGYDLLISIAVPHSIHWGVAKAWREDRRIAECWVADCGDPFMGNTIDTFRKPFYFKYFEKWFCKKADYITIPVKNAITAYYREFHSKIRVIPQGFRLDNLNIRPFKKVLDYPVFAYAGSFIRGKRDPRQLLDFLVKCNSKFKFIVFTTQDNLLQPYTKALGNKLEIRDTIPREELLVVLSGMDFLVNFDNNTETMLPSKLIDYAIAGRPVLNVSVKTDLSIVQEFIKGNYSRKMDLPAPEDYDIRTVAEKFIQLQRNF